MVHKRFTAFFVFAALGACATQSPNRFALREPLWVDPDQGAVAKRPAPYVSGLVADGLDKIALRPLSRAFAVPLADEAVNVNSMDEVPNSSWFENRIGIFPMTPQQVSEGACEGAALDPEAGPWEVVAAKPDGANPGFFIKAPDGNRYLLKFDSRIQPQRATSADVIGSKLYHAAGYHTPCNQIVYFHQDILKPSPKAVRENELGEKVPMTAADVEAVLVAAWRRKDGSLRASASRFLPGIPLGPFRYEGTRDDDPNDVIPHDKRRELRGAKIFAAWINHFDSREQNSLDLWVTAPTGHSFVRHYKIDWGDALGSRWPWDGISRRMGIGRAGYFDIDHVATDLLTLGLVPRPWNDIPLSPEAETFGYFGTAHFSARKWRGGYPNPAFDQMTERDGAWAARIVSRFSDEHIRAAVDAARMDSQRAADFLVATLIQRRDVIIREFLTEGSPLDRFTLVRRNPENLVQSLCFEDRAIAMRAVDPAQTHYDLRWVGDERLDRELGWLQFRPDPTHAETSCVQLPFGFARPADLAPPNAPDDHPKRYAIIEIRSNQRPALEATAMVRLHLYDLGPVRGFRLVGIERPDRIEHD